MIKIRLKPLCVGYYEPKSRVHLMLGEGRDVAVIDENKVDVSGLYESYSRGCCPFDVIEGRFPQDTTEETAKEIKEVEEKTEYIIHKNFEVTTDINNKVNNMVTVDDVFKEKDDEEVDDNKEDKENVERENKEEDKEKEEPKKEVKHSTKGKKSKKS
jgi:hypothetical protein